jgi:hypothetical protein
MEIPQPPNKALDTVDSVLNSIIYGVGVKSALTASISAMPWLGFPIIRNIFEALLNALAGQVFGSIEPYISYKIIKFQNEEQRKNYEFAIEELKAATERGDQNDIDQKLQAAKDSIAAIVSFKH